MDRPYIYVYDADALANAASYDSLAIPTHSDGQFHLRRIAGLPVVAPTGTIQVYSDIRRKLFSAPSRITAEQAVVPELVYAPDSAITFDLTNVLRANNATTGTPVYFSQLAFQGVRQFRDGVPGATSYRYHEKPYAIETHPTVTWSGRLFPGETVMDGGRQFNVPVDDFDFVLHHITMTQQLPLETLQPCDQTIKLMLYDVDRNQLMSAPVCDFFLNSGALNYNSLFPVPPLLYPAGSQILFDIHSLLANASLPCPLQIVFNGVRRLPC